MQQIINLKLLPSEADNDFVLKAHLAEALAISANRISGYHITKRSIDARGKQVYINLGVQAIIDEPFYQRALHPIVFREVPATARTCVIIGAGPAGLFAALSLIEQGIRPVILERGKDVRARRRDLALLNKEGIVNPESNYCFGEGGAGTYSDGKLYTRSNKRGDVNKILQLFVQFGAEEKILYESHPHIGTNKLPQIITNMRTMITQCGGHLLFEKKVTDFVIRNDSITAVTTADGDSFHGDYFILATGHSARDIFQLLQSRQLLIENKPYALGVRIEHPQQLIDSIQYHCVNRGEHLPPASYSLVQQVGGRGVFSFCMCPGGIIAPAATNPGELVVNGWSPSKRNNPYANSGMVVTVEAADINKLVAAHGPLAGMYFQQSIEKKAFDYGGGKFAAPAQRMTDLIQKKFSSTLPACSYIPGIRSASLDEVLPGFIFDSLQSALKAFGKKMKGYLTSEAVVVATESRTSSPVRIPRHPETLLHPQLGNLYPCSEGAGYAGGIISAAMDGEKIANTIAARAFI